MLLRKISVISKDFLADRVFFPSQQYMDMVLAERPENT
jgi:hypothetical protein